jgi:hypothetical protein
MPREPIEFGIAPPLFEPPPKAPKWPWVMLLVAVLLAVGGLAFGHHVASMLHGTYGPSTGEVTSPEPPVSSAPATRVVVFEVTGTGKAFNVTATVGASVQNEADVTLPWTRTVEVPADARSKSVMLVVVAGADGAEVHGRCTIDGRTVGEGRASGPYGVLTITGS